MLNKIYLGLTHGKVTRISFRPFEGFDQSIDIIEMANLVDAQVQLGADWLAISPKGYKQPVPTNSVDYMPEGHG